MIIKMIQDQGNRMENIQETINKDLEKLNKTRIYIVYKRRTSDLGTHTD